LTLRSKWTFLSAETTIVGSKANVMTTVFNSERSFLLLVGLNDRLDKFRAIFQLLAEYIKTTTTSYSESEETPSCCFGVELLVWHMRYVILL
jgi:hypothetical protein